MPSFMVSQMALSGEAHITVRKITLKGFLPIMNSHMSEEVALFSKCFFTAFDLTYERPFTSLH